MSGRGEPIGSRRAPIAPGGKSGFEAEAGVEDEDVGRASCAARSWPVGRGNVGRWGRAGGRREVEGGRFGVGVGGRSGGGDRPGRGA